MISIILLAQEYFQRTGEANLGNDLVSIFLILQFS